MNQQNENNMFDQSLGKRIRQFRERHGMSQSKLAEELSVTRQAVSNWERDKTLPDVYTLQQLAACFDVTLDEFVEGTKEPEITMPKTPGRLAAATGITIACYFLIGGCTGRLYAGTAVVMIIIGVFLQLFLHLYFSGSVKTGNFSALAGYDNQVEYNRNEVKKVLIQMDIHISCISFGTVLLYAVGAFLGEGQSELFYGALTLAYCCDLTTALLLYNYRSLDRTLVKEADRKTAKAGFFSSVWFVSWVLIFVTATFGKFVFGKIENNSPQAVGYLGYFFLFLLVTVTELFWEQHRVKKMMAKTGAYRPGAAFWFSTAAAFAVTVLMLL